MKERASALRIPLLKDAPFAKSLVTSVGYRLSDDDFAGRSYFVGLREQS